MTLGLIPNVVKYIFVVELPASYCMKTCIRQQVVMKMNSLYPVKKLCNPSKYYLFYKSAVHSFIGKFCGIQSVHRHLSSDGCSF